jgi:hypothetical protein
MLVPLVAGNDILGIPSWTTFGPLRPLAIIINRVKGNIAMFYSVSPSWAQYLGNLAQITVQDHLNARVARGHRFLGVSSHTPSPAGSFMDRPLSVLSTLIPLACIVRGLLCLGAVSTFLPHHAHGPLEGLHVDPSLCPS